jgi:regulator of protease activity HflC (stomatin/prohibitin superfamily)
MGYIVFAVILLVIAAAVFLAALGVPPLTEREKERGEVNLRSVLRGVAAGTLGVFVLVTVLFSATTVSPRSIGIQTQFGKYHSTMQPGLQWTAPWASVEEFSTQVQYLALNGDHKSSVDVNYQGGGKGNVDAVVRWRIDDSNAEALWRKYRTFENVRDQLVASAAKDSLRVVVGKYTPNDARAGNNLRTITDDTKVDLQASLKGDGITIDSVSATGIFLDQQTQQSIEKVVAANNAIQQAEADKKRAIIENETAKLRQQSGALSKEALERYCFDVTNNWDVNKNGPLPATWNCAGSSTAGVIVGAK